MVSIPFLNSGSPWFEVWSLLSLRISNPLILRQVIGKKIAKENAKECHLIPNQLREMIHFAEHIFQGLGFNHQLVRASPVFVFGRFFPLISDAADLQDTRTLLRISDGRHYILAILAPDLKDKLVTWMSWFKVTYAFFKDEMERKFGSPLQFPLQNGVHNPTWSIGRGINLVVLPFFFLLGLKQFLWGFQIE